jgi:hypothetical protein
MQSPEGSFWRNHRVVGGFPENARTQIECFEKRKSRSDRGAEMLGHVFNVHNSSIFERPLLAIYEHAI